MQGDMGKIRQGTPEGAGIRKTKTRHEGKDSTSEN
jgi:hypothetical protein